MRELQDHVSANHDLTFVAVQYDFSCSDASEHGSNLENLRSTTDDIMENFRAFHTMWAFEVEIASTPGSELEKLVEERFQKDKEFAELEEDLQKILFTVHTALQDIWRINPGDKFIERRNMVEYYSDILQEKEVSQHGIDAYRVYLEEHFARRKTCRRDIKLRIKNQIMKEMGLEVPAGVETATATDAGEHGQDMGASDPDSDAWKDIENGVAIVVGGGCDEDGNISDRLAFIQEWTAKVGCCFPNCLRLLTACRMN
jgi:hypothetical protein